MGIESPPRRNARISLKPSKYWVGSIITIQAGGKLARRLTFNSLQMYLKKELTMPYVPGKDFLFFDLETTADPAQVGCLPEPKAPATYKDLDKIKAYIEEAKAKQVKDAALDADCGQITTLSYRCGLRGKTETFLVGDPQTPTEAELLRLFWARLKQMNGRSCGYNTLGFDLPYVLRRSMDLCVPATVQSFLAKFREEPTCDLYGILYNWGPGKSLKYAAKRYGIPNPLPDIDGSMVDQMPPEQRRAYCGNDTDMVVELFKKMLPVYMPSMAPVLVLN